MMRKDAALWTLAIVICAVVLSGCAKTEEGATVKGLTDDEIDNLIRRSYQYVAMYNVINKNAMLYGEQTNTDGWNQCFADTALKDHDYRAIARPNNDTLYAGCMLDLRAEPVIVEYPAFDSKYVVLETSAYDHYCDVPLSTTKGDFQKPTRILYYTERTKGYSGAPVEGVDVVKEMTGDFVIAFLRVMPHAADPERMQRNLAAMREVSCRTLSEFLGGERAPVDDPGSPAVGATDLDIFGNNFLEVMQFVFNHTTFDPEDPIDREVLAAYAPLGVVPGKTYDPGSVATLDGAKVREVAQRIWTQEMARVGTPEAAEKYTLVLFKPKGQIGQSALLFQSIMGPIGLPASQAVYPAITTADREPMNAMHDYVIRMTADALPPAKAFWSVTLYDTENGFFIPSDRKKYSVGENAGMKLDDDGGIAIYIAAEQPEGVPDENWLPLNRGDYGIDAIMRIYAPDLERLATWEAPKAEKLEGTVG
jgi:hypothetical protein